MECRRLAHRLWPRINIYPPTRQALHSPVAARFPMQIQEEQRAEQKRCDHAIKGHRERDNQNLARAGEGV